MTLMDLGQRVLLQRRALGLSQEELAQRCGFRYQVISRLERGHQDIYAMRLARIAQELGVSADYLLGLCDDPERYSTSRNLATTLASQPPAADDQATTSQVVMESPAPTSAAGPPRTPQRVATKPAGARRTRTRPRKGGNHGQA